MIERERRRERMTRNLAEHMDTSLAERITAFARSGVAVDTKSGTGRPLGLSRFGGDALLPPGAAWPGENTAHPLELVAVIDMAAVGPMDADGLFPHHGVLNFFVEQDFDDCEVIHAVPDTAVAVSPPEEATRHAEKALYGRTVLTVPEPDDLERLAPDLVRELANLRSSDQPGRGLLDDYKETAEQTKEPFGNQIGGWPGWAQGTMFDGTGKQHLLFDLQGDGMDLTFGDAGSLYFIVEERDLRSRDFGRVHAELATL
ncbi:Uncharacterized protein YwqG [Actinopolyspora alba]|uniref:Uncharacterized protein YwqG n=1 Tax=Actinopolyspora alba TaxID=673379 RepID=A0A1I1U3F4_9ACTN|nr:YwqG family protein [Actinopolyspora alba]SFD63233.1 Uncharacterized protein YwqG [Actinopolyspora alba]